MIFERDGHDLRYSTVIKEDIYESAGSGLDDSVIYRTGKKKSWHCAQTELKNKPKLSQLFWLNKKIFSFINTSDAQLFVLLARKLFIIFVTGAEENYAQGLVQHRGVANIRLEGDWVCLYIPNKCY